MGILALMGSGELTATMVEVHKMLLSRFPADRSALFLDTPAGFQLNAEQIGATAIEYFRKRVGCRLEIASYRSSETISEVDAAGTYHKLRGADYVLMGPGSPTYAVEQLSKSRIPEILIDHIRKGGCLVSASAAALTAGRFTLPVYEIYKVGQPLHWVAGLDILGPFGLHLIVIPHWNNAEGGTHDTSRCFMGSSRFDELIAMLEEPLPVLGLDEHTACVIDFSSGSFRIYGIGRAILQHHGNIQYFVRNKTYPIELLQGGGGAPAEAAGESAFDLKAAARQDDDSDFWSAVHDLKENFQQAIAADDLRRSANGLLELDRILWQAEGNRENPELIAQARDIFREQLAELGTRTALTRSALAKAIDPIVDSLLARRQQLRHAEQFEAGDAIRDALNRAGIIVEDSDSGYRWQLADRKEEDNDQSS